MKTKRTKGFTLVELLVVIAIIAILATVSIVGYLSFSDKAKDSNDVSLVTQLNTVLRAESVIDGNNKTYHDALNDLKKNGFDIEKMTPTSSKNEILWDQESDRLVLLEKDSVKYKDNDTTDHIENFQLWKLYDEMPNQDAQSYSIYLKNNDYIVPEGYILKTGLDFGDNLTVANLQYKGDAGKPTLRPIVRATNSATKLTVDNVNAEVDCYGEFSKIIVTNAASNSVHIFAKINGSIEITSGRVVVENLAKVSALVVKDNAAKVEVKVETNVKSVVIAPTVNKDVIIGVATDKITEKDDTQMQELEKFAGGTDTIDSPYLVETVEQFLNIATLEANKPHYIKQNKDIEIDSSILNKTGFIISKFSGVYDGGGFDFVYKYKANKIINVFNQVKDITFKNLNLKWEALDAGVSCCAPLFISEGYNSVTFDNVDTYGDVWHSSDGANQSIYMWNCDYGTLTMKNCDSYANYYSDLRNSAFVGYAISREKYIFENCTNNGQLIGKNVAILFANDTYIPTEGNLIINNFVNNGQILGYENASLISIPGKKLESYSNKIINKGICKLVTSEGKFEATIDENNKVNINNIDANIVKYRITFTLYVKWVYKENNQFMLGGSDRIAVQMDINTADLATKDIYKYEFRQTKNGLNYDVINKNNLETKYVLEDGNFEVVTENISNNINLVKSNGQFYYCEKDSSSTILEGFRLIQKQNITTDIWAYDSNGNVVALKTIK